MTTFYSYCPSPVGDLLLAGDGCNLQIIGFPEGKARTRHKDDWIRDDEKFIEVKQQLTAYFAGERKTFDLALAPQGTEFQLSVWQALRAIPYGKTCSYGEIAQRIGKANASRAVGAANGQNPIPIILPCHRVIGSTGKLTGFGGGLAAKETLLRLENDANFFQLEA